VTCSMVSHATRLRQLLSPERRLSGANSFAIHSLTTLLVCLPIYAFIIRRVVFLDVVLYLNV